MTSLDGVQLRERPTRPAPIAIPTPSRIPGQRLPLPALSRGASPRTVRSRPSATRGGSCARGRDTDSDSELISTGGGPTRRGRVCERRGVPVASKMERSKTGMVISLIPLPPPRTEGSIRKKGRMIQEMGGACNKSSSQVKEFIAHRRAGERPRGEAGLTSARGRRRARSGSRGCRAPCRAWRGCARRRGSCCKSSRRTSRSRRV